MPAKAREVNLSEPIRKVLTRIANAMKIEVQCVERALVALHASDGMSNAEISREIHLSPFSDAKWRARAADALPELEKIAEDEPEQLCSAVLRTLSDAPRSGRPLSYTKQQEIQTLLIACKKPTEFGFETTHWTTGMIAETVRRKIGLSVSTATVHRILRAAEIKPHRSVYWLNSADKVENIEAFREDVNANCDLYEMAPELEAEGHHVVSMDEMTGLQVLERRYPDKPMLPGSPVKIEFEYIRHGTLGLTGAFNVATGTVYKPFLNPTRTAVGFGAAVEEVVSTDPQARFGFVLDGLNIHKSEELVRYVAEVEGIDCDLGRKGVHGVLKSMATREAFLSANTQNTLHLHASPLFLGQPD